jgi:hypothetical protein
MIGGELSQMMAARFDACLRGCGSPGADSGPRGAEDFGRFEPTMIEVEVGGWLGSHQIARVDQQHLERNAKFIEPGSYAVEILL